MLSGANVPDILLGNNLLHSPDSCQGRLLGIQSGALLRTPWLLCLFELLWPLKLLPHNLTFLSHLASNSDSDTDATTFQTQKGMLAGPLSPISSCSLGNLSHGGEGTDLASAWYYTSGYFFPVQYLIECSYFTEGETESWRG